MSFKFFATKKKEKPAASIDDITALFGEAAQAENFNIVEAVEQGISASKLLNDTAQSAFPDDVNAEDFDFKLEVINAVSAKSAVAQAVAGKDAAEQKLTAITQHFGDEANEEGFDVSASVETAIAKSNTAQAAADLFGDDAAAEDFDLVAATKLKIDRVVELEKKGGGSRTTTSSDATSGADNDDDPQNDFMSFEHNRKVMAEVKDLETYQSPKQESK